MGLKVWLQMATPKVQQRKAPDGNVLTSTRALGAASLVCVAALSYTMLSSPSTVAARASTHR